MSRDLAPSAPFIAAGLVSTTFEIPGHKIVRSLGLVGGNITVYTELCERARGDALDICLRHAAALGANGVVGLRYDANEIAAGVTEVLAYGTAVAVAPA